MGSVTTVVEFILTVYTPGITWAKAAGWKNTVGLLRKIESSEHVSVSPRECPLSRKQKFSTGEQGLQLSVSQQDPSARELLGFAEYIENTQPIW